mmetsp:Transcript_40159/g.84364  ORF Transcript_40159/g.84364 Transcript_40159/m.84364 type:complete len:363 (+) Transcript_40159:303-1391(+)|eukprot:CAMPEP_0183728620 /NCGR_PEP_ID=MMETSP0737-20130205/28524_1 /TAXON_ID=385413 /ORGANISM="Thalassiosira miniscula, Strain CCMP1093" /LENGTH=362 /DNA_ID=CAMNT_0025960621 /DNA_START=213 /DNA_END=1301 /DNA_ORIENTATION=-
MAVKNTGYGTAASASPAPTNVQVIAPATLKAGYTFDAMYDGVTFTVVVPDGGVIKGQRFIVPFTPPPIADAIAVAVPEATAVGSSGNGKGGNTKNGAGSTRQRSSSATGDGGGIPTGIWRDALCDCCRYGPFHPHFLNSLCFKPCLIGQIMTRMKMTWLGQRTYKGRIANVYDNPETEDVRWKDTFRNIVIITVAYYVIQSVTSTPMDVDIDYDPTDPNSSIENTFDQMPPSDKIKYYINQSTSALFGLYILYLLITLRATLRHVYNIPEESCLCCYQMGVCGNNPRNGICKSWTGVPIGWEDICCAFWCQLCIVAQMARHTVDYEEKKAVFCNDVGMEDWEEDEAFEGVEDGVGEGSVLVV